MSVEEKLKEIKKQIDRYTDSLDILKNDEIPDEDQAKEISDFEGQIEVAKVTYEELNDEFKKSKVKEAYKEVWKSSLFNKIYKIIKNNLSEVKKEDSTSDFVTNRAFFEKEFLEHLDAAEELTKNFYFKYEDLSDKAKSMMEEEYNSVLKKHGDLFDKNMEIGGAIEFEKVCIEKIDLYEKAEQSADTTGLYDVYRNVNVYYQEILQIYTELVKPSGSAEQREEEFTEKNNLGRELTPEKVEELQSEIKTFESKWIEIIEISKPFEAKNKSLNEKVQEIKNDKAYLSFLDSDKISCGMGEAEEEISEQEWKEWKYNFVQKVDSWCGDMISNSTSFIKKLKAKDPRRKIVVNTLITLFKDFAPKNTKVAYTILKSLVQLYLAKKDEVLGFDEFIEIHFGILKSIRRKGYLESIFELMKKEYFSKCGDNISYEDAKKNLYDNIQEDGSLPSIEKMNLLIAKAWVSVAKDEESKFGNAGFLEFIIEYNMISKNWYIKYGTISGNLESKAVVIKAFEEYYGGNKLITEVENKARIKVVVNQKEGKIVDGFSSCSLVIEKQVGKGKQWELREGEEKFFLLWQREGPKPMIKHLNK